MNYSGYSWIKVKKYKMDESKSWQERYKDLESHHIEETTFLIEKVRELDKKIKKLGKALIEEELDDF